MVAWWHGGMVAWLLVVFGGCSREEERRHQLEVKAREVKRKADARKKEERERERVAAYAAAQQEARREAEERQRLEAEVRLRNENLAKHRRRCCEAAEATEAAEVADVCFTLSNWTAHLPYNTRTPASHVLAPIACSRRLSVCPCTPDHAW